jgi:hypothetical protein
MDGDAPVQLDQLRLGPVPLRGQEAAERLLGGDELVPRRLRRRAPDLGRHRGRALRRLCGERALRLLAAAGRQLALGRALSPHPEHQRGGEALPPQLLDAGGEAQGPLQQRPHLLLSAAQLIDAPAQGRRLQGQGLDAAQGLAERLVAAEGLQRPELDLLGHLPPLGTNLEQFRHLRLDHLQHLAQPLLLLLAHPQPLLDVAPPPLLVKFLRLVLGGFQEGIDGVGEGDAARTEVQDLLDGEAGRCAVPGTNANDLGQQSHDGTLGCEKCGASSGSSGKARRHFTAAGGKAETGREGYDEGRDIEVSSPVRMRWSCSTWRSRSGRSSARRWPRASSR